MRATLSKRTESRARASARRPTRWRLGRCSISTNRNFTMPVVRLDGARNTPNGCSSRLNGWTSNGDRMNSRSRAHGRTSIGRSSSGSQRCWLPDRMGRRASSRTTSASPWTATAKSRSTTRVRMPSTSSCRGCACEPGREKMRIVCSPKGQWAAGRLSCSRQNGESPLLVPGELAVPSAGKHAARISDRFRPRTRVDHGFTGSSVSRCRSGACGRSQEAGEICQSGSQSRQVKSRPSATIACRLSRSLSVDPSDSRAR